MRNPTLLLNYKFDSDLTEKNVIKELDTVKRPMHYGELYHRCVVNLATEFFSNNTNPAEKFRQYFSDHSRSSVVFIKGGFLALRQWFPTPQSSLLPAQPYSEYITGNCDISWEAGYEIARREPYMFDYFNDSFTFHRRERRKRGSLVEFHVREYFRKNYSDFFIDASNANRYEKYADDDFGLQFPITKGHKVTVLLDVKSFSDHENKDGIVRNPKNSIVYLFADIDKNDMISMYGFGKGEYLKQIGISEGSLCLIQNNYLMPIDRLIVMLNIAKCGMDYKEILNSIKL